MSSNPNDPSPTSNDRELEELHRLNETTGLESLPTTDQTSAFDTKTKALSTGVPSKKKTLSTIGGYDVGEMLGQGGMGRVYRADDSNGRSVAIKLLSPDLARSPEALARFKQEGLIASQINHPNCVFVHRVDEDSGTPFIAMELMTGQTLKDLVQKHGPMHFKEAVRLILQCIDGLVEAHSLGMIHRDIKPANCYLDDDGNVKIGDFGLARSLVSDSELTQTGAFLGTPLFASPEQLLGQAVDARSDIYSLSATFYFLLAGKAPFDSPHAAQVIARIASSDPPKFKTAGVEVPPAIEQIVLKGLSRDASKRFATFAEMRNELQATIKPQSQPTTLTRRTCAWFLDYFVVTSLVAIILLRFASARELQDKPLWTNFVAVIAVLIYYVFCESIFAATIGKVALRIRVVDAMTGGAPSFARVLVRAIAFVLSSSSVFILVKWWTPTLFPLSEFLLITTTFLINIIILCSTWWRTGKRQLAHDWLSGTECRTRIGSRVPIRSSIELPVWKVPSLDVAESDSSVPKQLGRFSIDSQIRTRESSFGTRWFTGQDPQLERTVWLACFSDQTIEYEQIQNQKPKSLRLRFVEEGTEADFRWFAFVAPDGIPLTQCESQAIQFPWPITRSILGDVAAIGSAGESPKNLALADGQADKQMPLRLDVNRTWVDPAGRLCMVDFTCSERENRDIIPMIAKLGLPSRHRIRRSLRANKHKYKRLPLESLPPFRAAKMLESIASNKYSPTPANLKNDLEHLDKQSHEMRPSARFVSAAASLGLMSPLLFLAAIILVLPVVILISNGFYKEIRKLKSLAAYSENPIKYNFLWGLVSEEDRTRWTDQSKTNEIAGAIKIQTDRLENAMSKVGAIENLILGSIPKGVVTLSNPPIYGSNPDEPQKHSDDATKASSPRLKVNAGPMNVVEVNFGNEVIDAALMQSILESVERSKSAPRSNEDFPDFAIVGVGILICTLWTTITFGGITRRFTGLCIMTRDGRQLGLIQSFWRACVLYAPFLLVAYAISYCNLQGYEFIGWGTQLKRVFCALPILYLATAFVWYQRTPLDMLSGTVAVPR